MLRIVALLIVFSASIASADTLQMSGISADGDGVRPTRGMSQDTVTSQYGEPSEKQAAVGEPPISRWVYDDFIVYFEFDRVIHAVIKR